MGIVEQGHTSGRRSPVGLFTMKRWAQQEPRGWETPTMLQNVLA